MEADNSIVVPVDNASRAILNEAAELRQLSVSDYVRTVMLEHARRELASNDDRCIELTTDEQLQYWNALTEPSSPTVAQQELSRIMRGEV